MAFLGHSLRCGHFRRIECTGAFSKASRCVFSGNLVHAHSYLAGILLVFDNKAYVPDFLIISGTQDPVFACVRKSDFSTAKADKCARVSPPAIERRSCNTQPCPARYRRLRGAAIAMIDMPWLSGLSFSSNNSLRRGIALTRVRIA